jgi:RsiW-degrading membrane proteinase PrsW (M82 family)
MPPSPFQRKLAVYSRDRNFLIRSALTILAVCVILGFVVAKFAKSEASDDELREQHLHGIISYESERDRSELTDLLLGRGQPTPEALAHYITFFDAFLRQNLIPRASRSSEEIENFVSTLHAARIAIQANSKSLSDEQKFLFHNYAVALYKKDAMKDKALDFLREQAEADEPVRFANEFLGHVLSRRPQQRAEALPYLKREAERFPRSDFSRFRLLDLNLSLGNYDAVRTLLADASYRDLVSPRYAMEIGIRTRDLKLILNGVVHSNLARLTSTAAPLALFASFIWFIILAKLGGVERLRSGRLLLYSAALVAGCLSIPLTHVFIIWQEEMFGFKENGEFLNDLLYCISGIGLREETAKILLFLPFVFFIAKRRTQIEILIAAGCVGLGFATIENIAYFDDPTRGGPGAAFPRLVSAAFLHISLTGILGLALCRFWHYPKRCWEELVGTFVAVVLIHGIYDALIIVPQLSEQLGILAFVVLVLTIRHYFRKLAATRGPVSQTISPLAVYVLGSALVIGAAWIFAMRHYDLDTALDGVGKGALLSGILAFLYINELRNE